MINMVSAVHWASLPPTLCCLWLFVCKAAGIRARGWRSVINCSWYQGFDSCGIEWFHRSASKPVLRALCCNYTLLTILLAAFHTKNSWVVIFNCWQWWSLNFSCIIWKVMWEPNSNMVFVRVLTWSSIWNLLWVLVLSLQSNLDFQMKVVS